MHRAARLPLEQVLHLTKAVMGAEALPIAGVAPEHPHQVQGQMLRDQLVVLASALEETGATAALQQMATLDCPLGAAVDRAEQAVDLQRELTEE